MSDMNFVLSKFKITLIVIMVKNCYYVGMKKIVINPFLYLCIVILALTLCGCQSTAHKASPFSSESDQYITASTSIADTDIDVPIYNPYDSLSVPTDIRKLGDYYFIVDCYHNQVIYHDNLEDSLSSWNVMTSDINMGHTIASDGMVYLIDDTENNRILIMEKSSSADGQDIFLPTQEFLNIGVRPHYITYNDATDTFYAWSSMTGEMYLFRRDTNSTQVCLTDVKSIPELNGYYVRSFTIIDDNIYFVSGDGTIKVADLKDFSVKETYPVPTSMYGMVQLTKIEDYYYITISTDNYGSQDAATIIRTSSLSKLINGDFEDIYSNFVGGGTPYCITSIDDTFYLCEHRLPAHSIWSFKVNNNTLTDITTIY